MYYARLKYTTYEKGVTLKFENAVGLAFFIRDAFPKGEADDKGNPFTAEIWRDEEDTKPNTDD